MNSRVFAAVVVLATLGSSTTSQETGSDQNWNEQQQLIFSNTNLQDPSRHNLTSCLETCVSGLIVVRKAWQLMNQWYLVHEERKIGLDMCSALVEVDACKVEVERKASETKYQIYGSVLGLCVATFGVAFKIRHACFDSTEINEAVIKR